MARVMRNIWKLLPIVVLLLHIFGRATGANNAVLGAMQKKPLQKSQLELMDEEGEDNSFGDDLEEHITGTELKHDFVVNPKGKARTLWWEPVTTYRPSEIK